MFPGLSFASKEVKQHLESETSSLTEHLSPETRYFLGQEATSSYSMEPIYGGGWGRWKVWKDAKVR